MAWLLTLLLFLPETAQVVAEPLPSRTVSGPVFTIGGLEPANFDLLDLREEERHPPKTEDTKHSIFGIKRHVGIAAGYDRGVVHGSVGLYLTVAEWGRWNFGVPGPGLGIGRYEIYDPKSQTSSTKTMYTVFISMASMHYRGGYVRTLGLNWYVTLEQIFDVRANAPGSQFGISLSSK